ncbi:uncharacterized protein K460DRAFT_309433 [Cucurbitaria berberidis CBS 394.84]|uniref:Uncharacterized protein n=1 Tax=Cucurbitaria berberidis CBS 394.84 TaxID=1168544 RepID=A0A9P4GF64_9PLEO|nr:uncharacterized protein K460DRAFT_309433 [Cucurbitaria berberidis CBS 394.84]KAF1844502.1 hypothetical protein K460DRAFT_309433 [Cucurbitaria berberidis CBS 394.84]
MTALPETDQLWGNDKPKPTRTAHSRNAKRADGWSPDSESLGSEEEEEDGTGLDSILHIPCKPKYINRVYFSVVHLNGTLAHDNNGKHALFYISSFWDIMYPKTIRTALFNNATASHGCPKGHCTSKIIPGLLLEGERVMLKYIEDPVSLKYGWIGRTCQYHGAVREVEKLGVTLGHIGYFMHGASIPPAILDFVETRMQHTFPILEIILWGMGAGLILGLPLACCAGFVILIIWCKFLRPGVTAAWDITKHCFGGKGVVGIALKGAWARVCSMWNTLSARNRHNVDSQKAELLEHNLDEYPISNPPSDKTYNGIRSFETDVCSQDEWDLGRRQPRDNIV